MRKVIALLCLCLLGCPFARGEELRLTLLPVGETVRPGKGVTLSYIAPAEGEASLQVIDEHEQPVIQVDPAHASRPGQNELIWNGTFNGAAAPAGEYTLTLRLGEETTSTPIHIGEQAPYLNHITVENATVIPGVPLRVSFVASVPGTLSWCVYMNGSCFSLGSEMIQAGENSLTWDGLLNGGLLMDGRYAFAMTLTDGTGFDSNEEHIAVTLAGFIAPTPTAAPTSAPPPTPSPTPVVTPTPDRTATPAPTAAPTAKPMARPFTPTYTSEYQSDTSQNYWTLPMDITDERAVWDVLMQPMTVVQGEVMDYVYLRAEPREDAAPIGEITCATQGVHVLETLDNGWSLVEAYSSSFADSKIKAYAAFVTGYLPTERLTVKQAYPELGLVVDKLTQRLYVFREGRLFSTLLCSTGLPNEDQPYNETMAGEYMLVDPAVGAFPSGNMICNMGIRFNRGDILHEIPHVKREDGSRNYGYTEPKLGTKASHGCIRVQRKRTPEGVNMSWLWNNRANNIKLLIWEDWPGRQIPIPKDDMPLYYNANKGESYHSQETCYSIKNQKGKAMTAFTYGELEQEPYSGLKRCAYCAPPLRDAEYREINARYAAKQTE